jgi:hypothetical protein
MSSALVQVCRALSLANLCSEIADSYMPVIARRSVPAVATGHSAIMVYHISHITLQCHNLHSCKVVCVCLCMCVSVRL